MSAWLVRPAGAAALALRNRVLHRGATAAAGSGRMRLCSARPPRKCGGYAVVGVRSVALRSLCTAPSNTISYEQLKALLDSQSVVIIDVREPWEINEYGKIPGSINIPVGDVGAALQMAPQDFKEKYNRTIPAKSESVVFSCLAGVRSLKAMDVAVSLGYSRAQHYLGGFEDFVRHGHPVKQQ
ncbi:thiosulfate sulfurtransferase/rhodanese-like domain-containing protein 3 [Ambystoma mexicanum]|uniref:thiosulfate sulfurtransferase/rhodanese-like domain-containing protein 3 n=1 Tax=Ambystoma mexicanum TaxID=8296 RepID=UPI0037E895F6